MNTPGSISPGRTPGSPNSLWHLSTWSDYLSRIMRPATKQPPVHMTRRQELLAAQERKRKEQHAHVLELLREVKEKHEHVQQGTHKLKA
ncbi:hypothetical protein [Dyella sp.]|jgi:hypothetical protein|uniref:hypothetical protein n=1 Tax=Dyella sp. TaxID=1869338 RepID=UPI002FD8F6F3